MTSRFALVIVLPLARVQHAKPFGLRMLAATEERVLLQLAHGAAANLAEGRPCAPVEQPRRLRAGSVSTA